jgi:hypothetical protein
MRVYNIITAIVVLLVASLTIPGCKGDSPNSSDTSSDSQGSPAASGTAAASGPLVGHWGVDLDATASYHGMFGGYTDAERAAFEAASFEFTGSKFKYSLRDKSGSVDYKVQSATDQAVVLEMPGGLTPTLTFLLRPDGGLVLPQDGRWDMLVLKKK